MTNHSYYKVKLYNYFQIFALSALLTRSRSDIFKIKHLYLTGFMMNFINGLLYFVWIGIISLGLALVINKTKRLRGILTICFGIAGLIFQIIVVFFLHYNFEVLWASQFNSNVYSKMFMESLKIFFYAFIPIFIFTFINLFFAYKSAFNKMNKFATLSILVISLVTAVILGLFMRASLSSEDVLLFKHGVNFGVLDPVFKKDVSFYIYKFPIINSIQNNLSAFLFILTFAVFMFYSGVIGMKHEKEKFADPRLIKVGKTHFLIMLSLFLLTQIWAFSIEKWSLIAGSTGAKGIKYTIPAYTFSQIVFVLATLGVIALIFIKKSIKKLLITLGVVFGSAFILFLLAVRLFPTIMQSTVIKTNEFKYEKKYIEYKINMTRKSYGIDKIKTVHVNPGDLTQNTLKQNDSTLKNIRLHDYRAAHDVIEQLQRFRPYYKFSPIYIDQYKIDGQLRQVMISAREIDLKRLPENANTWINRHFSYTHGYGTVMFPVNAFSSSGEPIYTVKDIPVNSKIGKFNPRIYHGMSTNDYVFVDTNQKEFDYPEGDKNKFTTYKGKTGININKHKFLIAWNTDGFKLYYTKELKNNSKLLYRRNIIQRVKELYPFLLLGKPYISIVNGKLVWIIDGYSTALNFPYAAEYRISLPGQSRRNVDYFRNSVKIVVDAYHGTVHAYIVDKKCPIIKTWKKVFPNSFEKKEMSDELKRHMKFPPTEFELKSKVYTQYHITDAQVFYNREDIYQLSKEVYRGRKNPYGPYYQICRLPGQKDLRLNLMTMFTPAQTQIVRGLMGATLDPNTLKPRVVFYSMPKTQKRRDGIMQFLARIDQTPAIKEKLTLWGKKVMGNTLVYPLLEDGKFTLLYVQPVYIRSNNARFPQIKMIIVGDGANRITWGYNFEEAISNLLSENISSTQENKKTVETKKVKPKGNLKQRIKRAFNKYLRYLRENDFVRAGKALEEVKNLMKRF